MKYTYTQSTDTLDGTLLEDLLQEEIRLSDIAETILYVVSFNDTIEIVFENELTIDDELLLNSIVAQHRYIEPLVFSDVSEISRKIAVEKTAGEALSEGDFVSLSDADTCVKCGVANEQSASVIGVCLSNSAQGQQASIQIAGIYQNDRFLAIPYGETVFQAVNGEISTQRTTIVGEFFCRTGKSYGSGSILIRPEEPIEVSV